MDNSIKHEQSAAREHDACDDTCFFCALRRTMAKAGRSVGHTADYRAVLLTTDQMLKAIEHCIEFAADLVASFDSTETINVVALKAQQWFINRIVESHARNLKNEHYMGSTECGSGKAGTA